MGRGQLDNVLRRIGHLAAAQQAGELPDRELLERFVTHHDQTAFAAIVERHGALVLNLCRRNLRREQDVEDACQSTFLVLARKAGTIRKRDSLGSWLYGVASRIARNLASDVKRRASREVTEADAPLSDATGEISWREGLAVLDEELNRLPVTYRSALILCYLQGRTQDQAARELGCSSGALCGRLVRARECLRRRLTRRGVTLSAALLGTLLVTAHDAAALPPALAIRTVRAAAALLGGQKLARVVPASVATLTEGVLTAMFVTRVKTGAVLALVALLLVAAGAFKGAARGEKETPAAKAAVQLLGPAAPPADKEAKSVLTVRGQVLNPNGQPVAGAKLYLHASQLGKKLYAVRATSGSDGRFEFTFAKSELEKAKADNSRPAQVMAVARGHGCAWVKVGSATEELTLRLVKDVPITGRILDRDGQPVAGAKLAITGISALSTSKDDPVETLRKSEFGHGYAYPENKNRWVGLLPGRPAVLTTGPDGKFRLTGVGRERIVQFRLEGSAITSADLHVTTRAGDAIVGEMRQKVYGPSFDYLADPSRPIRGVVRDKATGKPITGVSVAFRPYWADWRSAPCRTLTDKEGRYELLGLSKSAYYNLTVKPGDGRYLQRTVLLKGAPGLGALTRDIDLVRGLTLRGKVTDKATGRPVAGARVDYHPSLGNSHVMAKLPGRWDPRSETITGPDGSYTLTVLPGPGVIGVTASRRDAYAPAFVPLKERLDFLKQSVPNPTLLPLGHEDCVDVAVGNNVNYVIHQDNYHALVLFRFGEKEKALVKDVALERPHTVKVRVVGADGKALTGVTVFGLVPFGVEMLPGAEFTVRLNPRAQRLLRPLLFYHRDKNLGVFVKELRSDTPGPLTVKLQACGSASGRMVDQDGQPVAGLRFVLRCGALDMRSGALEVTTDKKGRFRVEGLVPGIEYSTSMPSKRRIPPTWVTAEPGKHKDLGDIKN
jgi:RNA polymerase sigma factor (sigma-70 family)